MLDVIGLEARGKDKQDEYLRQAAHERLPRQLGPSTEVVNPSAGRPARALAGLGLTLATLAALVSTSRAIQGL